MATNYFFVKVIENMLIVVVLLLVLIVLVSVLYKRIPAVNIADVQSDSVADDVRQLENAEDVGNELSESNLQGFNHSFDDYVRAHNVVPPGIDISSSSNSSVEPSETAYLSQLSSVPVSPGVHSISTCSLSVRSLERLQNAVPQSAPPSLHSYKMTTQSTETEKNEKNEEKPKSPDVPSSTASSTTTHNAEGTDDINLDTPSALPMSPAPSVSVGDSDEKYDKETELCANKQESPEVVSLPKLSVTNISVISDTDSIMLDSLSTRSTSPVPSVRIHDNDLNLYPFNMSVNIDDEDDTDDNKSPIDVSPIIFNRPSSTVLQHLKALHENTKQSSLTNTIQKSYSFSSDTWTSGSGSSMSLTTPSSHTLSFDSDESSEDGCSSLQGYTELITDDPTISQAAEDVTSSNPNPATSQAVEDVTSSSDQSADKSVHQGIKHFFDKNFVHNTVNNSEGMSSVLTEGSTQVHVNTQSQDESVKRNPSDSHKYDNPSDGVQNKPTLTSVSLGDKIDNEEQLSSTPLSDSVGNWKRQHSFISDVQSIASPSLSRNSKRSDRTQSSMSSFDII